MEELSKEQKDNRRFAHVEKRLIAEEKRKLPKEVEELLKSEPTSVLRRIVIRLLFAHQYLACFQAEEICGIPHESLSGRFTYLRDQGKIVDTETRTPTGNGKRTAAIHTLAYFLKKKRI